MNFRENVHTFNAAQGANVKFLFLNQNSIWEEKQKWHSYFYFDLL